MDAKIIVTVRVVDVSGRARLLTPNPVPSVFGTAGSDAVMAKVRREFEGRGHKIRSIVWRGDGGLAVYLQGRGR